jgi:transcriptional regulator with XRE-family HTH domain
MPKTADRSRTLLAQRLDQLFRMVRPKDRGPYSQAEVVEAINRAAGENVISTGYLSMLCTGQRDNPTMRHLSALAAFFGVSPSYFFADSEVARDAVPAELVAALKDDSVRDLALRAAGLSDRSLRGISEMVESARALEGIPDPGTRS